ncbi:MAG: DUF6502 family protein [Steroidobacteraceae bacterium]|jgi:hypothetical protein
MTQSVKDKLLAAFRYLLKPLVRLALKNGVSWPDFSSALKKAYVDVASRQLLASKMDVTEEGISLMANVDLQDVREVLGSAGDSHYGRRAHAVSPMPVVLSAWHSDPKYAGPYGVLRDLEFDHHGTANNRGDTFSDLVNKYCPDYTPKAILDELLRIGAVADIGNGCYRAMSRSYIPDPLSAENIFYFARVMHNHAETLEMNLRPKANGGRGLIERSVFTQYGIPKDQHNAFDEFIRKRGQAFADDVDRWLTDRDAEGIKDGMQVGISFYHYIVNEEDERALSGDLENAKEGDTREH